MFSWIKKIFKYNKCQHHWNGWVLNGTGGAKVWCDKCGYEHYGCLDDYICQQALKEIQAESK